MATTLGTKVKDTFAIFSLLGLLVVGGPMGTVKAESLPDQSAIQSVDSSNQHSVLAKRFEDAAREMQAKADEQKKLLEQYDGQLYGREAQTLKSQTTALIRKYEQAARSNMKEAVAHRQMAQRQVGSTVIRDGETPQIGNN
ncbi:hypothetical protein [Nitrosospira sp. NpAV]|uniref:hypothetical protein n=1 Tax=Nitrosospira sp. NpAV TaxID=58133 RepID=UPI0005A038B0|nr:hypothetical protein [Nitrosospira sp. NpAV]KIO48144.1 hypothetical protein SQ11_13295 [Nitrosospira sp. NpAV]